MSKSILNYILLFVVLVVAQAVIFNNLVLFNSAVALVFLYMIVELPATVNVNVMMIVGFLLGLTVDIFQDTPGLNAMACTIVSFMRRPILHLYLPRDEDISDRRLSIRTLGTAVYLKYMITMVLIYCTIYFTIEAFSYFDVQRLGLRIILSSLFTFVVLYAIDSLTNTSSAKRL